MVKVRPLFVGRIPFGNDYLTGPEALNGAVEMHAQSYYMRMYLPSGRGTFYQQDFWHRIHLGGEDPALGLQLEMRSSEWARVEGVEDPSVRSVSSYRAQSVTYTYKTGIWRITMSCQKLRSLRRDGRRQEFPLPLEEWICPEDTTHHFGARKSSRQCLRFDGYDGAGQSP